MESLVGRPAVDRLEPADRAPDGKTLRPRDAATLIVLDRSAPEPLVLMGRRRAGLAFMAGKFVFPGGRTDPADARVASVDELDPREAGRMGAPAARARAIALSSLREAWEEAGVVLARHSPSGSKESAWPGYGEPGALPALNGLRLLARAVTPPGAVRRFDTRFLATWRDGLTVHTQRGSGELEALGWHSLAKAAELNLADITRIVLDDLRQRLAADPALSPGGPAFLYRMLHGRFTARPI